MKRKPKKSWIDDPEVKFDRARTFVGNLYQDFMLMVRNEDGSRTWITTNQDWAYGACRRYVEQAQERDTARMWREINGGDNA